MKYLGMSKFELEVELLIVEAMESSDERYKVALNEHRMGTLYQPLLCIGFLRINNAPFYCRDIGMVIARMIGDPIGNEITFNTEYYLSLEEWQWEEEQIDAHNRDGYHMCLDIGEYWGQDGCWHCGSTNCVCSDEYFTD